MFDYLNSKYILTPESIRLKPENNLRGDLFQDPGKDIMSGNFRCYRLNPSSDSGQDLG